MTTTVAITVTYHPDIKVLKRQLDTLHPNVFVVVVDNGSKNEILEKVSRLLESRSESILLPLHENRGLPAAINFAADWVATNRAGQTENLLLLDQDSQPAPGAYDVLLTELERLTAQGIKAMVGPNLIDQYTGQLHGFHRIEGWRWARCFPGSGADVVRCSSLNGSGTLMPFHVFQALGGLDELLFIDHVDTEWSFRAMSCGVCLIGVPHAHFLHAMGDKGRKFFWSGRRVWPVRSPLRHRYLFRNTVILLRRSYVPLVWKLWAVPKLVFTAILFALMGPDRKEQLMCMFNGVWEGICSNQVRQVIKK